MSPQSRPSPATLAGLAPVFTALGDATRLQLVSRLCHEGPLSITRLADGTALTRQAVTKHLRVLGDAGLAGSERHGREQLWHVDARRLRDELPTVDVGLVWRRGLGLKPAAEELKTAIGQVGNVLNPLNDLLG